MNAVRQEDHRPDLMLQGRVEPEAFVPVWIDGSKSRHCATSQRRHRPESAYGKPFSEKSLTGMIRHWTLQAGIPEGYTLHGLRRRFSPKQYSSAVLNRGQGVGKAAFFAMKSKVMTTCPRR